MNNKIILPSSFYVCGTVQRRKISKMHRDRVAVDEGLNRGIHNSELRFSFPIRRNLTSLSDPIIFSKILSLLKSLRNCS